MPEPTVAKHADAVLAAIASGMSTNEACLSNPAFPKPNSFKRWSYSAAFPGRGERLRAAIAEGQAIRAGRYVPRDYTEAQFDQSLAIVRDGFPTPMHIMAFDGCPGVSQLHRRAIRDPDFAVRLADAKTGRMHGGRAATFNDADFDKALSLIKSASLAAYLEHCVGGVLPSPTTLQRRAQTNAAFGRQYAAAMAVFQRPNGSELKSLLMSDDLYHAVNRRVPRDLDLNIREDVVSDLIEAVLAGDITLEELAEECADVVRDHRRQIYSRDLMPIDTIIRGVSLSETLSCDEWSFEGAV